MSLDIESEVAALKCAPVRELYQRYTQLFGEQARSRNKAYLVRKIAWRLQANAEGGLTDRARRRAEELAADAEVRSMPPHRHGIYSPEPKAMHTGPTVDPRIPPPDTVIICEYKGQIIRVVVRRDGFDYNGKRYQSLSALARNITGRQVNGFRFFKLGNTK